MTNERPEHEGSRRDLLRSLFRWLALGGLVGGAAALMSKRGARGGEFACINDANCRTCSKCCQCPLSKYESPGCGPDCASKS